MTGRSPLRRSAVLGRLAVVAALAASGACGTKAPAVTGLVVTVTFPVGVDQLELAISTKDGVALEPKRRPATAGAALTSPQSVSIYLPDALAGQDVTCTVAAFAADAPTGARGEKTIALALHRLVPLTIELAASSTGDAGAPDAEGGEDAGEEVGADGASLSDAAPADAPRANGVVCATGDECDSSLCVDGVCCASACPGFCEACNVPGKIGTCAPLPSGTLPVGPAASPCAKQPPSSCGFDGTCDGNGGCRRHPAGVACKAEACTAGKYVPASACDGQGVCMASNAVDCAPYTCDPTTGAPACRTDCRAGGADCVSPAVCAAGSCGAKPKQANGAGCLDAGDCASAHCVDGVCCATACAGACQSCNQTGFAGACRSVAAGKADPHSMCKDGGATACGRNGLCDGAGACALYPATTVCAAATCSGRMVRGAKRCDGKGACLAVPDMDCATYRCDPTTTACFTSCTTIAQCSVNPRRCVNMVCQ